MVELADDQFRRAATAEYKGFEIRVYELLDRKTRFRFRPDIHRHEQLVREIHVRSKSPEVSLNHFAKRAIDHFLRTRQWPKKQGMTVASV
jgi:hypothetical protein